jgi:hypothetical protein
MNERAPKTTGLQIALILSFMLATILAVTVYKLYRENQELKQQLEQQNRSQASVAGRPACEIVSFRRQFQCDSLNPDTFLLVFRNERYNQS